MSQIQESRVRRAEGNGVFYDGGSLLVLLGIVIMFGSIIWSGVSDSSAEKFAKADVLRLSATVKEAVSKLSAAPHGDIAVFASGVEWEIKYGSNTIKSGKVRQGEQAFGTIYSDGSYCAGVKSFKLIRGVVSYYVPSNTGKVAEGSCPVGAVGR